MESGSQTLVWPDTFRSGRPRACWQRRAQELTALGASEAFGSVFLGFRYGVRIIWDFSARLEGVVKGLAKQASQGVEGFFLGGFAPENESTRWRELIWARPPLNPKP